MMNSISRFGILMITAICLVFMGACSGQEGGSTTVVGNPSSFTVDPAHLSYSAVTQNQTYLSAGQDFLQLAGTSSLADVTMIVKRNGQNKKLITSVDLDEDTPSFFSFGVPAAIGDTITLEVHVDGETQIIDLVGDIGLEVLNPNATVRTPTSSGCEDCSGDETINKAEEITEILCNRLVACNPSVLTRTACETGIKNTRQLANQFGIEEEREVYFFYEVIDGIGNGSVEVNTTSVDTCLTELAAMPCEGGEGTVESGYNPESPKNFENVENLPSSDGTQACGAAFAGVPQTTRVVNEASQIVDTICNLILNSCYEMTLNTSFAECDDGIRLLTNLGDDFGLDQVAPAYATASVEEIIQAVENGQLGVNTQALAACRDSLSDTSCTAVENSYNSADPNNYGRVENFVGCEDVFFIP